MCNTWQNVAHIFRLHMVKLLNPSVVLVFEMNYFSGQMGFKFTVT